MACHVLMYMSQEPTLMVPESCVKKETQVRHTC